jgi:hypothetical protein
MGEKELCTPPQVSKLEPPCDVLDRESIGAIEFRIEKQSSGVFSTKMFGWAKLIDLDRTV